MYKQHNVVTTFCKYYALIEMSILISPARKVCFSSAYIFFYETYLRNNTRNIQLHYVLRSSALNKDYCYNDLCVKVRRLII